MNKNCTARSVQNRTRLAQKPRERPLPHRQSVNSPIIPTLNVPKKAGTPYILEFPTGTSAWWSWDCSTKPRRTLNQRQKRKLKRL